MAVNQRSRSEPQALALRPGELRRRPSLALAGSGLALTPGVFRAIDAQASEGQLLRPLRHSEPREREHAVRDRFALARSLPRERVPVHLYQPRSRRRERRHRGDCDHDQKQDLGSRGSLGQTGADGFRRGGRRAPAVRPRIQGAQGNRHADRSRDGAGDRRFRPSQLGPIQPVQVGADGKAASLQSAVHQHRGRSDRRHSRARTGQGDAVPGRLQVIPGRREQGLPPRNRVSGYARPGLLPIWSSACRNRCCRATTVDRKARDASSVSG